MSKATKSADVAESTPVVEQVTAEPVTPPEPAITAGNAPAHLQRLIFITLENTRVSRLDTGTADRVGFLASQAACHLRTLRQALRGLGVATVDDAGQPPVPGIEPYIKAIEGAIGATVLAYMNGTGPMPQQMHLNDARKAVLDFKGALALFNGFAAGAKPVRPSKPGIELGDTYLQPIEE